MNPTEGEHQIISRTKRVIHCNITGQLHGKKILTSAETSITMSRSVA
ncbi:MAG: hypothetical protein L3J39_09150 [Verrucomicrobiales bacterium]|nr:hypothetical protein [Verrucomicrobiales bacterium]